MRGTLWGGQTRCYCQTRKKEPKPKLFGPDYFPVFHVKGWGPKSSACPSKPGKPNFFGGISRDFFAGISRRCPKSLRKQKYVFNFSFPIFGLKNAFPLLLYFRSADRKHAFYRAWKLAFFSVFGCHRVTVKVRVWEECPQVLAGKARKNAK